VPKDHSALWRELDADNERRRQERLSGQLDADNERRRRERWEAEERQRNSLSGRFASCARGVVALGCFGTLIAAVVATVDFAIGAYGFMPGALLSVPFVLVEFVVWGKAAPEPT
jgi:anti-sigma factor RsiW